MSSDAAAPTGSSEPAEIRPQGLRISDADRQRAAEVLERACGEGRLTLEEFSIRVGAVWASQDAATLAETTADLMVAPPVGLAPEVESITTVFSSSKRHGRWRLPRRLKVTNVFGETKLDLREAALSVAAMAEDVVEISGTNVFGTVEVIVPEGVEVEVTGSVVFGDRSSRLAPVQRLPGTPLIRVTVKTVFGETKAISRGPNSGSPLSRWLRGVLDS
jgi:hypothetical protein